MQLPPIHLAIMQPAGYVHSLGFLDQARYARYQFRRMGAEVSLAKNRLREDALNIVFGAHLGFDAAWLKRHSCLIFNLEQLGDGGARVAGEYLQLLRHAAVVDYDAANLAAYTERPEDVPVVPFLHAPYLNGTASPPLEERPIDLLFFGSMNPQRQAMLQRIEACGWSVAQFDYPLYGEERDQFIRQAKAVVNTHFYASSRFEQARAFHTLSLGTPFVSQRTERTHPPQAFEDCVSWFDEASLETFFREEFGTPAWFERARQQLDQFTQHDPIEAWADLLAFGAGFFQADQQRREQGAWQPTRMNLGSGKDYKPGWLNVDILARAQPDVVLDLAQALDLPQVLPSLGGGEVRLEEASLEHIYANNVLEHVPDLPGLMTNLLRLLKLDGILELEVPYEKALTAWQDPTHIRAMNENSWLYYTDWFWYLGWFEHRFEVQQSGWLDTQLRPCAHEQAAFMRLSLRKVETTLKERTVARTMRPDFAGVADDRLPEWDDLPPELAQDTAHWPDISESMPLDALPATV